MELKYRFTDEERALLRRRFEAYLAAAQLIAELHGLSGSLDIAPDLSGFVADAPVHTSMVRASSEPFHRNDELQGKGTSQGTSESV